MRFFFCCLFTTFAAIAPSIMADEPLPVITWAKNSAPPFYITEGDNAGAGFADGIQAFIEQTLPQFEHKTIHMPLTRLNDFWHKGANYCFASMIYRPPSQSSDYVLSHPHVYYLPHGVIARSQFLPVAGDTVELKSLFTQPDLVLGLIGDRAFGETIDALMKQHQDTIHSFIRSDRDGVQSLLRMLVLDRIDYFIDYRFVYEYYRKQAPFHQQLRFMTVAETAERGVLGAVGCTDNTWGSAIMPVINNAIAQLLQSPQYRDFVADWQAVDMDHEQYWRTFYARVAESSQTTGAIP